MRYHEPLLEPGEDRRLARAVEAGILARACLDGSAPRTLAGDASDDELAAVVFAGERARERLVLANLRLVHTQSLETARRWALPFEDLFSEAVLGLLDAVERFDWATGATFGQFAAVCIRHRLHGATATRCGELHVTRSQATTARRAGVELTPPRALCPADDERVPDYPADDRLLTDLLGSLSSLERAVVLRRFGLDRPAQSQRDVSAELGLSRRAVKRLEVEALQRLRDAALNRCEVPLAA